MFSHAWKIFQSSVSYVTLSTSVTTQAQTNHSCDRVGTDTSNVLQPLVEWTHGTVPTPPVRVIGFLQFNKFIFIAKCTPSLNHIVCK